MTPEAQRIAIAEACGWRIKACQIQGGYALYKPDGTIWTSFWDSPSDAIKERLWDACSDELPDYLNDLNAMHEAEKTLKYEEQPVFLHHLKRVLMRISPIGASGEFEQSHATASQRAEAFLRTIGKWEDGK